MKRIIATVLIATMMTGCGKIKHLIQPLAQRIVEPKIIEKEVEKIVYAPYEQSWISEFTGKRLIAKTIWALLYLETLYLTHTRGYDKGKEEAGHDATESLQHMADELEAYRTNQHV